MKPQEFAQHIIDGSGWATDQYIINFAPEGMKPLEMFETMMILAEKSRLHNEGELDGDERTPSSYMSTLDVVLKYGYELTIQTQESEEDLKVIIAYGKPFDADSLKVLAVRNNDKMVKFYYEREGRIESIKIDF